MSYAGIYRLFNRVEREEAKMDEHESLLSDLGSQVGRYNTNLGSLDTKVDQHSVTLADLTQRVLRLEKMLKSK